MEKTAIISPASITPDSLIKRLRKFASRASVLNSAHLSNLGTHFDLNATKRKSAHIFSPLDSSFSKAFVIREFPVLYANDFTICWLAKMLVDMGQGSAVHIEIPDEKINHNQNHLTLERLSRKLPGTRIERVEGTWIRMAYSRNLITDIESLPTIYKRLHHKFDKFCNVWASNSATEATDFEKVRADATRTFIYSLFGANHNGTPARNLQPASEY